MNILEKFVGLKLCDCVVAIEMQVSADLNRAGVSRLRPNVFYGTSGKTVEIRQASGNRVNEKCFFAA